MAKITKLQIGLLVGASVFILLALPLALCVWLYTHKPVFSNKPESSYDHPLPMDWGRLVKRSFDPQHQKILLAAYIQLAEAEKLVSEHKVVEARPKFDGAMSVYEDELGRDSGMATSVGLSAGRAEAGAGNWKEAARFFQRVLDNNAKRDFDQFTCSAMLWLANAKENDNDAAGAKTVLSRCLALQEKSLGKDSVELIYTLNSLARVLETEQADQADQSEKLYLRALTIAQHKHENDNVRACYATLAEYYYTHGQYDKSTTSYKALLPLAKDSSWRAYYLENLSKNYCKQKKIPQMRSSESEALELRRHQKPKIYPFCIISDLVYMSLAECMDGNEEKSKTYLDQALSELNDGSRSPNSAHPLSLGEIESQMLDQSKEFVSIKKWKQAEALVTASISCEERDKQSAYVGPSSKYMAQLMAYQGDYDKCKLALNKLNQNKICNTGMADLILVELCTGNEKEAKKLYSQWQKSNFRTYSGKIKQNRLYFDISEPFLACLRDKPRVELKNVNTSFFGAITIMSSAEFAKFFEKCLASSTAKK